MLAKIVEMPEVDEEQRNMSTIRFEAKLFEIGSWTILLLPKSASAKLPSRGMVMVKGTINEFYFQSALEPDGNGSHWFRIDDTARKATRVKVGDSVTCSIRVTNQFQQHVCPQL